MARTLNTTVMVGDVIYEPGTKEPDIDGTVTAEGVWDGEADEPQGYEAMTVADLKAEIERRNEGREDDKKVSAAGNKAELIAALTADDEA